MLETNNHKEEIKEIFLLVELLIIEGDESVSEAAATCFLENLINATSGEDSINANDFVHLLGQESKKYCKAWDVFTGVKTEGLWSDDEDFEVK